MDVNATYAILCNNYGHSPVLLSQPSPSSAAAQQKASEPLRQSLLLGAVKGLQALEAGPWPPCPLRVCLPPPGSSLLTPPSSPDPPQACETSLTTWACRWFSTRRITSSSCQPIATVLTQKGQLMCFPGLPPLSASPQGTRAMRQNYLHFG